MTVAIIDYDSGNNRSVEAALERLNVESVITKDAKIIKDSDHVIFPGVGHAETAMQKLKNHGLDDLIKNLEQPFLGICLGMQLLCTNTEEGKQNCLGLIPVEIKKFTTKKVPQIGWNQIYDLRTDLFKGIEEGSYVYFVHSYYAGESKYQLSKTDYSTEFSSSLAKDNFYAVQFHPEKSGVVGELILKNFLELC